MEPSKYVAFCPYRDEAIQRIDDYLNERQELENDKEMTAEFDRLAALPPGTPPKVKLETLAEEPQLSPRGKPLHWFVLCCGWPEAAREAAFLLRDAGEAVQAKGIFAELNKLPDEVRDWDQNRLGDYHNATREAAIQVKAILAAIRPLVPVEMPAKPATP